MQTLILNSYLTCIFHWQIKDGFFLYRRIIEDPLIVPQYMSDEAADLVSKLLTKDESKRLGAGAHGAEEIKKHPFFKVSFFPISFITQ
jgi:serine/threonine protein kinase